MKQIRAKKKYLILSGVILLTFTVVLLASYLLRVKAYQQKVRNLTFTKLDIHTIPDGVYTGEFDVDLIRAVAEVTVKSGKIINIQLLEHKNERGAAAETITDSILSEQKIDVDAVSGATNSSRVIKKAVENALLSAQ